MQNSQINCDLDTLWARLSGVHKLKFISHSDSHTGWCGSAIGTIKVLQDNPNVLRFMEKGRWASSDGLTTSFSNIFRWTRIQNSIQLEHLRYGENNPVFLFNLVVVDSYQWESLSPHICNKDRYKCTIHLDSNELHMHWLISGPKKKEDIRYTYL